MSPPYAAFSETDTEEGGVRVYLEDKSGWLESTILRSDLADINFGSSVALADE
ncbi:MAG: hypothetical protein GY778_29370, partial [bacterium]|nr:hypothetical protein [bacterium]